MDAVFLRTIRASPPSHESFRSNQSSNAHHCARIMKTHSIEPLESRVAPAAIVTFTDVDGDLVTVKTSKGSEILLQSVLTLADEPGGVAGGKELQTINLGANGLFQGTSLTVTAKRTSLGGDGLVNVGYVNATNLDLAAVRITGDLGAIDCGDGVSATPALASLKVQSLGRFGTDTGAPDLQSNIDGRLGVLVVKSDVQAAFVAVVDSGGDNATIGSVRIGGSLFGGVATSSGRINAQDGIGPVSIGRDIVGGFGISSGVVFSSGSIGPVTVGGSLIGGTNTNSGQISCGGNLGPVKIGGDIRGGAGAGSGIISAEDALAAVTVGGALIGGENVVTGVIESDTAIGPVRIGGSVFGGSAPNTGKIHSDGTLGKVRIGGGVIGGQDSHTGEISSGGAMGAVQIRGSLVGSSFDDAVFHSDAGVIIAGGLLASLRIGGDVRGGTLTDDLDMLAAEDLDRTGYIQAIRIGSVFIGGSLMAGNDFAIGGNLVHSGSIRATSDIGAITIKGDIVGLFDFDEAAISARGQPTIGNKTDVAIKSLTVGGSVKNARILAGYDTNLFPLNPDAQIGRVTVGGDWQVSDLIAGISPSNGLFGDSNDIKIVGGDNPAIISQIKRILIKGQVIGTASGVDFVTFGFGAERVGAFTVGTTVIPLTAGAHNDTFPGAAKPVGSTTGMTPDTFDVHVFEV
jgi:hypothetical protein